MCPVILVLFKLDIKNYILCLTKFYITIFCIIILDILCILYYFMIFCKHFATTTSFVILKMPLFTIYKNMFLASAIVFTIKSSSFSADVIRLLVHGICNVATEDILSLKSLATYPQIFNRFLKFPLLSTISDFLS